MAKDPIKSLEVLDTKIIDRVAEILNRNTAKANKKLRDQHLRGSTSSNSVRRITRGIKTYYKKAELVGTIATSYILSPVKWAGVHIGPRGSSVTLTAKGNFLAIPTDFAKNAGGRGRAKGIGPKDQIWGPTKVHHGIIWGAYGGWSYFASGRVGKGASSEGMRQRRAAGEKFKKGQDIPLFILKKSVVVRRRVDPQVDVIEYIKPLFFEDLKKSILKVG